MYFYFAAEYPSAIKINGIFYGKLSSAIKPLRIDEGCPLIEICPLVTGESAINFILDEHFLAKPPSRILITDLKGGYLLKFLRRYYGDEFKVICQRKYDDCIATLFNENRLKLSIETRDDFYAQTFNIEATDAEISKFLLDGNQLLAVCIKNEVAKNLFVYSLNEKIQMQMCRQVDDYLLDGKLVTTERHDDIAKHTVTTEWTFNQTLKVKSSTVTAKEGFASNLLNERLVPYAFLEAFLIGGEWKEYLCPSILSNSDKLKDYFGEYVGVTPPPTFRDQAQVGLIYRISENLYSVDYYTFELNDKKITNLNKIS